MNATVVRVRTTPDTTDQYGDPVPGTTVRTPIEGAVVAPLLTSGEGETHTIGRNGVVVGYTLYTPEGVDIRRTDQVEINGDLYDVEGQPGQWVSPYTTWAPGHQVALHRAEG